MAKSLNDILAELGYTTEPVPNTYNKRIIKDGELVGSMSSGGRYGIIYGMSTRNILRKKVTNDSI